MLTDRAGNPRTCEVCGEPARGITYDARHNRIHDYCRAHHPMMPGGVQPIEGRTPASTVAFAHPELMGGTPMTRTGNPGARVSGG
jgi:hypothetical protein